MPRQTPAIVVIGATGYTGRLIARELAGADDDAQDSPVVLAARDADRLRALAAEVPAGTPHVVDVTDPGSLERLIRPGDAVINTAGPFAVLGEPVVRACIDAGAHYFDTTGEQPWMHHVHDTCDRAAREAGVAIVNAMAFEYALGDCALAVAAAGLPTPLRTADVIYAWGGAASSRGTRRTVLRMLGQRGLVRRDGRFRPQTPGATRRRVRLASGSELHAVAFPSGEVVTAPRHTDVDTVRGWLVMSVATARIVPWIAPALPVVLPLLRPVLDPLVTRAPDPTPGERAASRFTIRVEVEARDGSRSAAEIHGHDPYGITAVLAVRGARRVLESHAPAGVLAPAQLVEPGPFLASLRDHGIELIRADDRTPPEPTDRNDPSTVV